MESIRRYKHIDKLDEAFEEAQQDGFKAAFSRNLAKTELNEARKLIHNICVDRIGNTSVQAIIERYNAHPTFVLSVSELLRSYIQNLVTKAKVDVDAGIPIKEAVKVHADHVVNMVNLYKWLYNNVDISKLHDRGIPKREHEYEDIERILSNSSKDLADICKQINYSVFKVRRLRQLYSSMNWSIGDQ